MKIVVFSCIYIFLTLFSNSSFSEDTENLSTKIASAIFVHQKRLSDLSEAKQGSINHRFISKKIRYSISLSFRGEEKLLEVYFSDNLDEKVYDQSFTYSWNGILKNLSTDCIISDFFDQKPERVLVKYKADIQQCRSHLQNVAGFYSVL